MPPVSSDISKILSESSGVATKKAQEELSASKEQTKESAEPIPSFLKKSPYYKSVGESEYLITNLDELVRTVPKLGEGASLMATRDPPDDELTHGHDFWRSFQPDDGEAGDETEPEFDPENGEQLRLQEWDWLARLLELVRKAFSLKGSLILAPPTPNTFPLISHVRTRLLLRRLLAHAVRIHPIDPLLVAVVQFLVDRRQEQHIRATIRQRALSPSQYQSTALVELRLTKSHERIARRLTLASAGLPAVQIGLIEEQTAAAALRSLSLLLEEQLPAHFGLGQLLETALEVAFRGGFGQDYLAFLVEICLVPDGPLHVGIPREYLVAVRQAAAEVNREPLCRWLQGLFVDWRPDKLRNRLHLEMNLLKQADKQRKRSLAQQQNSETGTQPQGQGGGAARTGREGRAEPSAESEQARQAAGPTLGLTSAEERNEEDSPVASPKATRAELAGGSVPILDGQPGKREQETGDAALTFHPGAFVYWGQTCLLSGKPLDVIRHLDGAQGRCLTLAALRDKVWGDAIIGDETIRSAVCAARKALREAIRAVGIQGPDDPLPIVDRGSDRTAWRLDLP